MKYTLLGLVQSVLRSIKGEAVNDITDTQEAMDVADIVKECYFTIVSRMDLPETKNFYELDATGSILTPVLMSMPDTAYSMEWLEYNCATLDNPDPDWRQLEYMQPLEFLKYTDTFDITDANVTQMLLPFSGTTIRLKYRKDRAPTCYTSSNDDEIYFDSFDSTVESTLQKSKTRAFGVYNIPWTVDNTFIPNLDAHQFQLLLKEAKAMAWQELKSIENGAAVKSARQLMISAKGKRDRVNQKSLGYYYDYYPNYGRK